MNTVISVRIDKNTKDAAQAIAQSVGLNLSSLINSYLSQVAATRRIEIYAPEPMTPKLEKLIGQVEKEINNGDISQAHTNADDFIADLERLP